MLVYLIHFHKASEIAQAAQDVTKQDSYAEIASVLTGKESLKGSFLQGLMKELNE